MLLINKKAFLVSAILIGMLGCNERKVLTVNTSANRPHLPPIRTVNNRPKNHRIKEEILIGNKKNRENENIKVDVPKNNPTVSILDNNREPKSDELNGKFMERMPFPEDEYRGLKRVGNSTVTGDVYLQCGLNDEVVKGSKIQLYLNPVTSYSRQWYEESYLNGYKMSQPDKRLYNYLKFTTSDDNGKFYFYGVPKGKYYLGGKMNVGLECGFEIPKIIRIVKEIYVGNGMTETELTKVVP